MRPSYSGDSIKDAAHYNQSSRENVTPFSDPTPWPVIKKYSRISITWTFSGNKKGYELSGVKEKDQK